MKDERIIIMTTTLEISANVKFDSVAEARIAGQAIEQFLGIKGKNGVRLYSFETLEGRNRPSRNTHPLYLPERSMNITRGRQEVETRVMNLVKNVRVAIPTLPAEADVKEEVMILDGNLWTVDYQRLFDNVGEFVEKAEVKEAFNSAVALTLQQEATGRIR
jgi:hypothetical protein